MKKRLQLCLFFFLFLLPFSVNAAETIASYHYKFEHYGNELKFSFDLQSDGTLIKEFKENSFFDGSNLIHYFGKNKFDTDFVAKVYQNNKIIKDVPVLYYCKEDMSNFYDIYTYSAVCSPNFSAIPIYGEVDIHDEELANPSQAKVFCERTRSVRYGFDVTLKFFLDASGNKKYSVYRMDGAKEGSEAFAYESISLNQFIFQLEDDVLESFFKDETTCKNTPLYFRTDGTSETVMHLTTQKPSSVDNGSFRPSEADGDHGSNIGGEDDGSFLDDSNLCKDGNCDIDISQLCNETRVARTLKFLGIIVTLLKIFVPLLIIVLGSIDFAKAMMDGKADEIPKKLPILMKRFIVGVVIFLIPSLIDFLFGVIDTYSETMDQYENCWTCILDPDDCDIND